MLVSKRRDLVLTPNFEQGMSDPYNAIKAEIALLDLNLTTVPKNIRASNANDPKILGSYLVAMYNGGTARIIRAIKQWGSDWAQDRTTIVNKLTADKQTTNNKIKQLKKDLTKSKLTTVEKKKLNSELTKAKSSLTDINNKLATSQQASLKKETALYVAKYFIVYDHFANNNAVAWGNKLNLVP